MPGNMASRPIGNEAIIFIIDSSTTPTAARTIGPATGWARISPIDDDADSGTRTSSPASSTDTAPRMSRLDAAGGTLQDGWVEGSGPDGGDEFGVRIRAPARHLQVKSGDQRRHPVLHGAPVGDDKALEAPVVAQHLGQQPRILRGVYAVDLVVRAAATASG